MKNEKIKEKIWVKKNENRGKKPPHTPSKHPVLNTQIFPGHPNPQNREIGNFPIFSPKNSEFFPNFPEEASFNPINKK